VLLSRVNEYKIKIEYRVGRYRSLPHERIIDPVLHEKHLKIYQNFKTMVDPMNGLNNDTLVFEHVSTEEKDGYTHIKVKL
jgi:hypothetical protein